MNRNWLSLRLLYQMCIRDRKEGQEFTLTTEEIVGNEKIVSVTYKDLYKDVKPGNSILIDDGLIGLEVKKIKGQDIICKVVNGGVLGNKKGVNLPGVEVNMPFISPKDVYKRQPVLWHSK